MIVLCLLPAVLSLLLLAAHFYRAGNMVMVFCSLAAIGLLLSLRRWWVVRTIQVVLLVGAAEWVRTTIELVIERHQEGQPALLAALILGVVGLFTACSALLLATSVVRCLYHAGRTK